MCKEAKANGIKKKIKKCVKDNGRGSSRELYKTVKYLPHEWKSTKCTVTDTNNQNISDRECIKKIWEDHCE